MQNIMNNIKNKIINEKKVAANISNLMILEVTKYIFPLITMPYLVRTLGFSNYGVLVFSQTIANYFVMLTNYGFNLSAPRSIAICENNIEERNKNASTIFTIKSILFIISILSMLTLIKYIDSFNSNKTVYLVSMGLVLNEVIFPKWFFQGMEEMDKITVTTIIGRLVSIMVMFIIVKNENHLVRAAFIQVLGGLVSGIISMVVLMRQYKYRFRFTGVKTIIREIKDGWDLFISQFLTVLFSNINVTFLGVFTTPEMVGVYSAGEKIVRLAVSLVNPISMGIFPNISKRFIQSPKNATKKLKEFLVLGGVIFSIISIGLFLCASIATILITGALDESIIKIIRILSILPLFVFINNIYGTQYMLNNGLSKKFRNIIFISSLILTLSSFFLIQAVGVIGAALSSFIGELSLVILAVYYVEYIHSNGGILREEKISE